MVSLLARLWNLVVRSAIAGVLTAGALLAVLSFEPGPGPIAIDPGPDGEPSPTPSAPPTGAPTMTPSPVPSITASPGSTPGASPTPTPKPGASTTPKPTATPAPTPTPTPKPTATPTPVPAGGMADGSFTGPATDYTYGTMTVTITVSGGKIVGASVVQRGNWPIGYKNSSCTAADFNSRALTVSSGNELYAMQFCSGATYSKWGYSTSLQGAIDKAKR